MIVYFVNLGDTEIVGRSAQTLGRDSETYYSVTFTDVPTGLTQEIRPDGGEVGILEVLADYIVCDDDPEAHARLEGMGVQPRFLP